MCIITVLWLLLIRELLKRVQHVNDSPSERVLTLHCSGKIKPRSKVRRAYCKLPPSHICTQVIFGTGDFLKGITLYRHSHDMGVAVLGAVYADDQVKLADLLHFELAAIFTSTQLQGSQLSIPVTLVHATAAKRWLSEKADLNKTMTVNQAQMYFCVYIAHILLQTIDSWLLLNKSHYYFTNLSWLLAMSLLLLVHGFQSFLMVENTKYYEVWSK